jgi:hypothetical protein
MAKAQNDAAVTALDCSEHIVALETVLFSLDPHARELFEKQLAVERAKHQKRREELRMIQESLRATVPKIPS